MIDTYLKLNKVLEDNNISNHELVAIELLKIEIDLAGSSLSRIHGTKRYINDEINKFARGEK